MHRRRRGVVSRVPLLRATTVHRRDDQAWHLDALMGSAETMYRVSRQAQEVRDARQVRHQLRRIDVGPALAGYADRPPAEARRCRQKKTLCVMQRKRTTRPVLRMAPTKRPQPAPVLRRSPLSAMSNCHHDVRTPRPRRDGGDPLRLNHSHRPALAAGDRRHMRLCRDRGVPAVPASSVMSDHDRADVVDNPPILFKIRLSTLLPPS